MNFILRTENLTKRYRKREVVSQVNLNIPEKSVYGLLGLNGAGKSTILKMISGIVTPSDGAIFFEGHNWNRNDLKYMGALIENPPIYGNLSAYENMKVRTLMLGLGEEKIQETLEKVGLQNVGNKRAGHFSLGMKQRLGIALAIINEPKLLILDEPTNGLDPFGIEELRKLIRGFADSGMTVILSSHILNEVQMVADYIGILSEGTMAYEGRIDQSVQLEDLFMEIAKSGREYA